MSTKNKKIAKKNEIEEENIQEISAKELYDKRKAERLKEKAKKAPKSKKITKKKTKHFFNLGTRIFVMFMLLLMIVSTVISIVAYIQ